MRRRAQAALLLVLAILWGGGAAAQQRVALVIGNADYATIPSLANPRNDATDIAVALEGLGFSVIRGLDLTREGMADAAERFGEAASEADVALLYYAGHGFQADNRNYLVPTDARIARAEDVRDQTTPLETFLAALEKAPGERLVFLDACRDDPFGGAAVGAEVSDGLARVGDKAGFLVAYATQPDNVAYDGTGRNSFFTEAMLAHLYTPGQDVGDMMIAVRGDVMAATGGRQIPFESSSLRRRVVLDRSPVTASEETMLYQVAASEADPSLMQLYLERYPEGAHAASARAAVTGAERAIGPVGDDAAERAERLWQLARRTRIRPLLDYYLTTYPEGAHAAEAARLLDLVPAPEQAGPGPLCERLATHPRDATASTPGVPFSRLQANSIGALQACSAAMVRSPELPHYVALLARATAAAGDTARAAELYVEAAARGDLRAMVSLAELKSRGDGVPLDPEGARELVRLAAERGSPDALINQAIALFNGEEGEPDPEAGVALLKRAAEAGSAIASYNLGALAQQGVGGAPDVAVDHFLQAALGGEPRGFRSAAILVDQGVGAAPDPERAADLLLRAVAEDGGETLVELTGGAAGWSVQALAAMQSRLAEAGLYGSTIDGQPGPGTSAALTAWREGGFDAEVLGPVEG